MRIKALAFLLLVFASSGCAYLIPPQKIPMDRRNYLDAVSTSWKEQLLSNLVKLRYGDTLNFLEMTSITTGYELGGNLSASYPTQWHPLRGTTGFRNVVTVGGAVNYIDRPTITYAPLKGDALSKTVMMPLPVPAILRSLQTGWRTEFIFSCCIKSINGLRNHSPSGHIEGDPAFFALANRFGKLSRHGVIRITIEQLKESTEKEKTEKMTRSEPKRKKGLTKQDNRDITIGSMKKTSEDKRELTKKDKGDIAIASIVIDKRYIEHIKDGKMRKELEDGINLFYKQLGLDNHQTTFEVIDGNRKDLLWVNDGDKIVLQTRSIFESINMLSEFIELPEDHIKDNRVHEVHLSTLGKKPWLNCTNDNDNFDKKEYFIENFDRLEFRILSSIKPPDKSFVAVKYQDYWFYIEDKDIWSKFIFSGTVGIFSMSEPTTKELTPVLTLPVQ